MGLVKTRCRIFIFLHMYFNCIGCAQGSPLCSEPQEMCVRLLCSVVGL